MNVIQNKQIKGEVVTDIDGKVRCELCFKYYDHLGSHLKSHNITSREYKEEFELDYNTPLLSDEVLRKKREAFEENREKYIKNLDREKYQFKKGHTGQKRVSMESRKRYAKQLKNMHEQASGKCPVCNLVFSHMESHLHTKHGLVYVKKVQKFEEERG